MRVSTIGMVVLFVTMTSQLAAESGKTMETSTGKVYVDEKGMTLYTFTRTKPIYSIAMTNVLRNGPVHGRR